VSCGHQELIGDKDPEIAALTQKCERVKKLTDFYLSKVAIIYDSVSDSKARVCGLVGFGVAEGRVMWMKGVQQDYRIAEATE